MSVTFDGVALVNPEEYDLVTNIKVNEVTLLSGKNSVQTSSETYITVSFRCLTQTYSDVTNLQAKIGSKATLIMDEGTYNNCVITAFSAIEIYPDVWEYNVSFTRDTS